MAWFDELWNDGDVTKDVKAEVLAALERLGLPYALGIRLLQDPLPRL